MSMENGEDNYYSSLKDFFVYVSGPSCKTRWGNIRDNFRKSLKKTTTVSGQNAKNIKLYKY